MEGLTVGKMVHYVAYGTPKGEYEQGAHRAAVIAELVNYGIGEFLDTPEVVLAVFNPTGIHWNKSKYSKTGEPGTWHFIESEMAVAIDSYKGETP